MKTAFIKTPLGTAKISGDDNGIASISILDEGTITRKIPVDLKEAANQLQDYFNGKRTNFDFKLNPQGTEFQKKFGKRCSKSHSEKLALIWIYPRS